MKKTPTLIKQLPHLQERREPRPKMSFFSHSKHLFGFIFCDADRHLLDENGAPFIYPKNKTIRG